MHSSEEDVYQWSHHVQQHHPKSKVERVQSVLGDLGQSSLE